MVRRTGSGKTAGAAETDVWRGELAQVRLLEQLRQKYGEENWLRQDC